MPTQDEANKPGNPRIRVLVLGMPRTGTSSVNTALRTLGYTPYTMRSLLTNPKHIPAWQKAIDMTQKQPPKTPDFDTLLSGHDAVADLPGCIFAPQLIQAYPDAKVILTTRDYNAWHQSMQSSIWVLFTWHLFTVCRVLNITQMAPLIRLLHSLFKVHNGNAYEGPRAKEAYDAHYAHVRDLVNKENLLEIDADEQPGWDVLCEFLGKKERPQTEYPRLQEETAMRAGLEQAWWGMVRYLLLMVVCRGLCWCSLGFCMCILMT